MHQIILRISSYHLYGSGGGSPSDAGSVIAIIGIIILIVAAIYGFYGSRNNNEWENGMVPSDFKPTPENIFEIFICAACAIIARDPARLYYKFGMVNRYMKEYFPQEYYDFEGSYRFSLKHIVKIDSLAEWCNKNLDKDRRTQLVNFLLQLAIDDGELLDDEKQYIFALITKLRLNLSDLDPELSAKLVEQQRREPENTRSKQLDFYGILGLTASATIQEVKAAYRKLAKMTHPDRFSLEPQEVQEQMKIKFQKIQEAYEAILTNENY